MKGITMATNTQPRMTARQRAAARAKAKAAEAKAKAKAKAETEAEAKAKAETEAEAKAETEADAKEFDPLDYSSYVEFVARVCIPANAKGQLSKPGCYTAVTWWSLLAPVFKRAKEFKLQGFEEFESSIRKAMDCSAMHQVKIDGLWKGTTRDFLVQTPKPNQVISARRKGTLTIG